jgi:hypothetical protein
MKKYALYDAGFIIFIIIVAVCAIGGIISDRYLGDDNQIEEAAEAIIKEETGINIDLSPKSPEIK